jgi:hypothetical protein
MLSITHEQRNACTQIYSFKDFSFFVFFLLVDIYFKRFDRRKDVLLLFVFVIFKQLYLLSVVNSTGYNSMMCPCLKVFVVSSNDVDTY